ncbi:hypothetical protein [Candidatus Liberibacter sp.]|uniref:hypothetical protein n=1 Tax=Candidatus Liberibacter sp. TaxID=34022 RepID=UPI0015F55159|nr:hypothetical protein [Candidatus Liberibacter sp.]MBA5723897.1 hypothetical protein [Candidatus Liberibacter sp.]MBA5723898.1 hypothetical protein [Candidatus Liberibacter sp.]
MINLKYYPVLLSAMCCAVASCNSSDLVKNSPQISSISTTPESISSTNTTPEAKVIAPIFMPSPLTSHTLEEYMENMSQNGNIERIKGFFNDTKHPEIMFYSFDAHKIFQEITQFLTSKNTQKYVNEPDFEENIQNKRIHLEKDFTALKAKYQNLINQNIISSQESYDGRQS